MCIYFFANTFPPCVLDPVQIETVKLLPSDRGAGDQFGYSVGISNNYAIVGAPNQDTYKGAAYIFEYSSDTWTQVTKITAIGSDRDNHDKFGYSVAVGGNYLKTLCVYNDKSLIIFDVSGAYAVVGAVSDGEDENAANHIQNAGSVYVYERISGSWTFVKKLLPIDRQNYGYLGASFGCAVSLDGDSLVVGARSEKWDVDGTTGKIESSSSA